MSYNFSFVFVLIPRIEIQYLYHTNYFSRLYNYKKEVLHENPSLVSKYLNPLSRNLEYFKAKTALVTLGF